MSTRLEFLVSTNAEGGFYIFDFQISELDTEGCSDITQFCLVQYVISYYGLGSGLDAGGSQKMRSSKEGDRFMTK